MAVSYQGHFIPAQLFLQIFVHQQHHAELVHMRVLLLPAGSSSCPDNYQPSTPAMLQHCLIATSMLLKGTLGVHD
jgi:hypothetical protein